MSSIDNENIDTFEEEAVLEETADSQPTTISGIYQAFKDVRDASRATASAQKELKALQAEMREDQATLDHRRDVEANFLTIIQEQTNIVEQGIDSQHKIEEITQENTSKRTGLVRALDDLKKENRKELEPFHVSNDAAQKSLDEAARQLAHFKRADQTNKHKLESIIHHRDKQSKSLNSSIESCQEQLAKLKRQAQDPESEFSSRDLLDLREKIAIEQKRLAEHQQSLRSIQKTAENNIQSLESTMSETEANLNRAKAHHDEVKKEAEYKLKRLEEKSEQCRTKEEALQAQIDEIDAYQKTLEEHNAEIERAIEQARDLITEAHDIHETPEVTQQLALKIMRDETTEKNLEAKLEDLQEFEDDLRQKTRTSRITSVAVVLAVVLLLVFIIVAYSLGWFS